MTEFIELHLVFKDSDEIQTFIMHKDAIKAVCKDSQGVWIYTKRSKKSIFGTTFSCAFCVDSYEYVKERLGVQ